jgi:hypothetical protein
MYPVNNPPLDALRRGFERGAAKTGKGHPQVSFFKGFGKDPVIQ